MSDVTLLDDEELYPLDESSSKPQSLTSSWKNKMGGFANASKDWLKNAGAKTKTGWEKTKESVANSKAVKVLSSSRDINGNSPPPEPIEKIQISSPTLSHSTNPFLQPEQNQVKPLSPLWTTVPSEPAPTQKMFGVPLVVALQDAYGKEIYSMPPVLTDCFQQLQTRGVQEPGIFRIAGSVTVVKQLRDKYDQRIPVNLQQEPEIHTIASLFKMYFRELPEHLLGDQIDTIEQLAEFLATQQNVLEDKVGQLLGKYIELLPKANLLVIHQLFALLNCIAKNESVTLMTPKNLCIIYMPALNISSAAFYFLMKYGHLFKSNNVMINKIDEMFSF